MSARVRSLPRASAAAKPAATNGQKASTAKGTASTPIAPSSNTNTAGGGSFLLNDDGDFTGPYRNAPVNINRPAAAAHRASAVAGGGGGISSLPSRSTQQQQHARAADLSDSDEDTVAPRQQPTTTTMTAFSGTSSSSAAAAAAASDDFGISQQQLMKKQRELSKFEQKQMTQAAQRQRENIVQPQVVRGVEFKGSAFKPSVPAVRFDDFVMNTEKDHQLHRQKMQGIGGSNASKPLKEKSYSCSITFTNVSLAAASLRPDAVPREFADCLVVHFAPCGMVSPGMSTTATVIFTPKEMVDIDANVSFTTSTGKLLLPVVCRVPRLTVAVSTRAMDFDVVTVGTASERRITVSNTGSLGTAFSIQGEILDEINKLRHPTLGEMVLGRRKRLVANDGETAPATSAASGSGGAARQQADEAGWDEGDELWFGEEDEDALDTILEQEEIEKEDEQEKKREGSPDVLTPTRNDRNSASNLNTPPANKGGHRGKSPITSGRGGGSSKAARAEEEAQRLRDQEEAEKEEERRQRAAEDEKRKEAERQAREEKKRRLLRKKQLSTTRSHQVVSFVETAGCDASMIDDLLHGEPLSLPPGKSITVTLRFHPTVSMEPAGFSSSFFVAFESDAVDDVPVLVKGTTKELPVALSSPTDVVANHCGYYGMQYRSEVTIENRRNVSVRVTPKVPPRWRNAITFTPATAVTQPNEKFTFRVKLIVPEPATTASSANTPTAPAVGNEEQKKQQQQQKLLCDFSSVLFHVLFYLADESLPLILFVSGKFCRSSLVVTPQTFNFGTLNEREFSSKRISVFNPGLLPRSVCVYDFPHNVTVTPKTVLSAAAMKKSLQQQQGTGDGADTTIPPMASLKQKRAAKGQQQQHLQNQTNMLILPGETFEFDVAMRPPDPPAPGIQPLQEWTDVVTLRCDDDARLPITMSGARCKPPLEFSSPLVLLPRCAVNDVVSVSVVLKNRSNSRKSFCFSTLHPKMGVRVSPISGDIEKHGSIVVTVEFHAHSSVVETVPMLEADLRPTEAELALQQAMSPTTSLADTKRGGGGGGNKNKRSKQEEEEMAKALAAAEDLRRRCVSYCEAVCVATSKQLKDVQPWEQAEDDQYRVSRQRVGPSDPVVELFAAMAGSSSSSAAEDDQQQQQQQKQQQPIFPLNKLPLPSGCTQPLFATVPSTRYQHCLDKQDYHKRSNQLVEPSPVFTRTVTVPCHVQGWNDGSSWVRLSVRCTVVPPTVLAQSQTTMDILEQRRAEKLKESQAIRQRQLEQDAAAAVKPKTPRGGNAAAAAAAREAEAAAAAAKAAAEAKAKAVALAAAIPRSLQYQKDFKDSCVEVLFPPTASITGRSTNSMTLSFSPQQFIHASQLLDPANNNNSGGSGGGGGVESLEASMSASVAAASAPVSASLGSFTIPPQHRRVFITVAPLDPHGPFELLVPPRTELVWSGSGDDPGGEDDGTTSPTPRQQHQGGGGSHQQQPQQQQLLSTDLTFAFRPQHSALYRVDGTIIVSCPEIGVVHSIQLRFEGEGLPTSFAVSCERNSLIAEAAAAAEAAGMPVPAGQRPTSARGSKMMDSPAGGRGAPSPGRGGATTAAAAFDENSVFGRFAMPVVSLRKNIPAMRVSLGHALVGSARAQESVYVLNRSAFPVTCRFDVAAHRCAPSTDSGGVLPFSVEPCSLHLAPFAVGEATLSCSTLTSATFLGAIRVTTSANSSKNRMEDEQPSGAANDEEEEEEDAAAEEQKIQSESELLLSCCVWDYPVFSLLPNADDPALSAGQLAAISAAVGAQGEKGKNASSSPGNNRPTSSGAGDGKQQQQQQPLWVLPPKLETKLRELSLAQGLELSVVSRKQKKAVKARTEAFQALNFSAAGQVSPLLSGGGANVLSIVSAASLVGGVPSSLTNAIPSSSGQSATAAGNASSSIDSLFGGILTAAQRGANSNTTTTMGCCTQQQSNFLLHLANAQNPYGRDLYFGASNQPGSCPEFPLVLKFVTTMDSAMLQGAAATAAAEKDAEATAAEKAGSRKGGAAVTVTTSSSISNSTATIVSSVLAAEKTALSTGTGTTSSNAKKAGFNAAGAQAAMTQPVAAPVGHQIVVGSVRSAGSTIPTGVAGEFAVEGAVLEPTAARQGWKVEPAKGNINVSSAALQRVVLSFTPTAALVNALPVPGVSVSSSVDMRLQLRFGNAEPQTVYIKLVGQVKRN